MSLELFSVFAALLAIQSIASLRDGCRFLRYVRRSRRAPPGNFTPSVAVIIPCKGIDAGFELNISRFLAQDYPNYQIIFVVATPNDPAYVALESLLGQTRSGSSATSSCPNEVLLEVAGCSDERGEKVHNLLRGLAAMKTESEILVFADSDARPGADWLRSLVAPLESASVMVSTGFRWYLPGADFASQLRAAWDTSVATLLGEHRRNFVWGGSTAMRAEDFRKLQIAERHWAHTVSDDYAVKRAVNDAGGWIRFEPRCLLASRGPLSFREFIEWSNRQIILTRVYAPRLWRLGLAAHGLYCSTFFFGTLLLAWPTTDWRARVALGAVLSAILLLGFAKGRLRAKVAREIFPEERELLSRHGARYWQLTPLVPWVMLFNFIVAGFTRRMVWRGTEYELISRDEVRVLKRNCL